MEITKEIKRRVMKRKTKSIRKKLVANLDKVFSLYIRDKSEKEYKGCPFCGKPIQCCFHFITRAKYSVRWDVNNAVGSCMGCNMTMEFNPHPFSNGTLKSSL